MCKRVAAQPSHGFALQMADGSWWEGVPAPHIDLRWLGAKLDNVTDDRNAVLSATVAARAMNCCPVHFARSCVLSRGEYNVSGVVWHGVDPNRTVIKFISPKSVAPVKVRFDGAGGWTGGGIRRLCLWADSAAGNAGTGITLAGNATYQPDESIFEDVKVTGTGTWDFPMYLKGSARVGNPPGQGLVGLSDIQSAMPF
jgi:hypothetical protein